MKIITDSRCTEYHAPGHPERPQRVLRAVERFNNQTEVPIDWIDPLPVTDEQLLRAHTATHLDLLRRATDFDADTPAYPAISEHARRSAGAALQALGLCRQGQQAFSLMRPPGHHAMRNHAMGFCYLNNVAVAVLEARATGLGKVAVFDFDVHHGNGTEDILLDREGCAFFSVHQWPAYPGTGEAHRGRNCFNYPVQPEAPASAYRAACSRALDDVQKFAPDVLAVSAGFDSYKGDLLCQQNMDVADFHWLGETIRQMDISTFCLLEGGYSKALPDLILAFLKGWSGASRPISDSRKPL